MNHLRPKGWCLTRIWLPVDRATKFMRPTERYPQNRIDVFQSISASRRNVSCNLSSCVYTHRKLWSYHQDLFPNMPSRIEYYYVIVLNHYPTHFILICIVIRIFHEYTDKDDLSSRNERRSVNLALTSRNVSEA